MDSADPLQQRDQWALPDWLLPSLAVIVGVVLVATCFFFVGRSVVRSRRAARQAAAQERRQRALLQDEWSQYVAREKTVMDRFLSYDRDLSKLLAAPLMRDYRNPQVVAAVEAMNQIRGLSTTSLPEHVTDVKNSAYAQAVRDFEQAVRLAERTARRSALSGFSPEERRSVERARKLLAIVLDQSATQFERRSAYRRVIAELDGLLEIPPEAYAQLASRTRLELTDGPQDAILALRTEMDG